MKAERLQYKGIVVSAKANYLDVEINESQVHENQFLDSNSFSTRLLCTRRSRLDHNGLRVNVGDLVYVEEIDWNARKAVVFDVEPRQSWLNRPPVANVTNVVVVISLSQPEFNFDQASRFLLTGEQTGLKVSLVLTKIDLITLDKLNQYKQQLLGWGYDPICISIKQGIGIDHLLTELRSMRLAVLCGPSGVGKSSLINYLLPKESIPVSSVSKKLGRGRHTTRNVELFALSNDSLLADTPGFNRPEIEVEANQLQYLFPELRSQIINNRCKFRDCLHRDEPGCVVNKSWHRYIFYRECVDELIHCRYPFLED